MTMPPYPWVNGPVRRSTFVIAIAWFVAACAPSTPIALPSVSPAPIAAGTGSPIPTPAPTPLATSAPSRAVASGGAVPDAGVILFTDAVFTLWRYDGATGGLLRVLNGRSIDQEGPDGV